MPKFTLPHNAVLDYILDYACPQSSPDEEMFCEYHIELHCAAFIIVAHPGQRWQERKPGEGKVRSLNHSWLIKDIRPLHGAETFAEVMNWDEHGRIKGDELGRR